MRLPLLSHQPMQTDEQSRCMCMCISPTHCPAHNRSCRSALRNKDYGLAAAAFEAALSLNPLYPDTWFSLGFCYLKLEQQDKALQVGVGVRGPWLSCC